MLKCYISVRKSELLNVKIINKIARAIWIDKTAKFEKFIKMSDKTKQKIVDFKKLFFLKKIHFPYRLIVIRNRSFGRRLQSSI